MTDAPGAPARPVPVPSEIEVLSSVLLGRDDPSPGPLPEAGAGVRATLDAVLCPALARGPCFVSFSGGRDSSAVLALACDAARRHGLALPIPVTMRFPAARDADERSWQELVLAHLGVSRHEVVTLGEELDALGPAGAAFLRRHGVRWPANAYMHAPLTELARGGTILTGVGGDELFENSSPPRRLRSVALSRMPRWFRAQVRRRRDRTDGYGWLTVAGRGRVARALAAEEVSWPYPWDAAVEHWYGTRAFAGLDGTLALLGHAAAVSIVNPLLAPGVLAELRRAGGARGFPSRADAVRWLTADLLPAAVIERRSKAVFDTPVWGPETRGFVTSWAGEGVDPRAVDVAQLKLECTRAQPDARCLMVVQTAWLAAAGA